MASSSGKKGYPPRLYDEGKTPIQTKSMNYNCYLSNLQMVKEGVGKDVWIDLKNSSLGIILKLKEMDYIWSSKVVHYFLTHQLAIKRSNEIWSLIDDRPIRFSLYEFAEITGLNCSSFDTEDIIEVDHREFWVEMNVSPSEGPTFEELEKLFPLCRNWSFEERRMIGMLSILLIAIYGRSPASRIPLESAKRVLHTENFERYPWGHVAFKSLVDSIKVVSYEGKKTYTMQGFVHALLIWVYESVHGIGESYGNQIAGNDVPLISWKGSRKRIKYDLFVEQEKKLYEKVRVRHMIVKPENEIYPQWDDDNDDEELDNMISDIINNCLDASVWDVSNVKAVGTSSNKRKDCVSESYVSEKCLKKNKEDIKLPKQQSNPPVGDNTELKVVGEITLLGLIAEVKTLTAIVNGIDAIIVDKMASSIDAMEVELLKKIVMLETEVKCLKKGIESVANSIGDLKDDAASNVLACLNTNFLDQYMYLYSNFGESLKWDSLCGNLLCYMFLPRAF